MRDKGQFTPPEAAMSRGINTVNTAPRKGVMPKLFSAGMIATELVVLFTSGCNLRKGSSNVNTANPSETPNAVEIYANATKTGWAEDATDTANANNTATAVAGFYNSVVETAGANGNLQSGSIEVPIVPLGTFTPTQ